MHLEYVYVLVQFNPRPNKTAKLFPLTCYSQTKAKYSRYDTFYADDKKHLWQSHQVASEMLHFIKSKK